MILRSSSIPKGPWVHTYKIAVANDGSTYGYIWMTTPAMRKSFELYGNVLLLDMMKRMLNSQQWSYVGTLGVNDNKKIEVDADGMLVTESISSIHICF